MMLELIGVDWGHFVLIQFGWNFVSWKWDFETSIVW